MVRKNKVLSSEQTKVLMNVYHAYNNEELSDLWRKKPLVSEKEKEELLKGYPNLKVQKWHEDILNMMFKLDLNKTP